MRRALIRIWTAALLTCLPYRLLLWYRTDYLGHTIAGFGGTLLLLGLLFLFRQRITERQILVVVGLALTMGFWAEMTIFKIAKFDPVDFANQSLGACIAGLSLLGQEWEPRLWIWISASATLFAATGIVVAHG